MAKPIQSLFFIINFTIAFIIITLWMKNIKYQLQPQLQQQLQHDNIYQSYNWLVEEFRAFAREIFNIKSSQQIVMLLSVYLFAHFVVKSLLQFIGQYFHKFNYVNIIKCLNNIVDSMLVFSMILGFLLVPMYVTNYQVDHQILQQSQIGLNNTQLLESKYSQQLIFIILQTFFYGRILFSIGYIFGTLVKLEAFRATGVGFSVAAIVLALSQTYGFDILKYY